MFQTIALILVIVWAIGMVASWGGVYIHFLLVMAIVMVIARILAGGSRRPR